MDSLAILIPVALLLCAIVIAAFLWAVKSDQFEDLERHGQDVFFEEEPSAHREPSAGKEPSAREEPSAKQKQTLEQSIPADKNSKNESLETRDLND